MSNKLSLCHDVDYGTYDNTVGVVAPWGKVVTIDICMIPEIKWLWNQGIQTLECCCGHKKQRGYVAVIPEHELKMETLGYVRDKKAPHVFYPKSTEKHGENK